MRRLLNRTAALGTFLVALSVFHLITIIHPTVVHAQAGVADEDDEDLDLDDDLDEDEIVVPPPKILPSNGETPDTSPGKEVKEEGNTEIHVKDADIGSIIKIFSKKTKRNYILDERVKGKVSIFLPAKVSDSEATRVLDAILSLKGFTTVPIGGNVFKIIPSKDAKKTTIPTIIDSSDLSPTATVVTRLIRLNYVGAEDLQTLLGQLVSSDGLISAYARSNSLVVIDYADNIKRIVDIVDAIDVPSSDTDMTIVPIMHADSADIAETIKEILSSDDKKDDSSSSGATRAVDIIRSRLREAAAIRADSQNAAGGEASNVNMGVVSSGPKIIPDQRTNSIILVANEAETNRLRALINQLDSPVNLSSNRFYVYRCQHAKAQDLAEVLTGLDSGSSSSSSSGLGSSRSSSESGSLFGSGSNSARSQSQSRTQDRISSQQRTPGQSRRSDQGGGSITASLGEDISITADPATNSLIIAASKTDYEKILELLKDLDVKRRQVLVEATILEVSVTDTTDLGINFSTAAGGADGGLLASNSLADLSTLFTNPAALSSFTLAAASAGTIKLPGGTSIPSQALLVKAAKSNQNVNVLSAPNILTTDNEEAEIVVGQNVPFISSTSTTQENLNNTFNQVDRQDVGITLRFTPQISSGEFVTLHIFTEVSGVVPNTESSPLGPTTTLRTSQTTVITKTGQMIAIGGLISDNNTDADSGVPFLKDIPILGQVFRSTKNEKTQTNLLIFITPRIIQDQFDSREVTYDYRDIIEGKIDNTEVGPRRQEILHNQNLDNVAEASRVDGPQPGTIRSNRVAKPIKENNLTTNELSQDTTSSTQDKIVLRVAPPLPRIPELDANDAAKVKAEFNAPLDESSIFVLLKGISDVPSDITSALPFPYAPGKPVGLILPTSGSVRSANFFSPGSHFGYKIANQVIEFDAIGVFKSSTEADALNGAERVAWRTLSPYEIINLGNGPWIRR